MFQPAVSDLWWKNAIVYCIDVEAFMDSDGDGVGDFRGLTQRIPYLAGLGVTCLWLLPFYPSPQRDDGYDVSDYYSIDPAMGTLGEFVEFVRTARDQGIRVVIALVVNHTSDEHPWFQAARSSRDSPYRNWYVWADEPPEEQLKVIFPDQEDSNWARDEQSGQYYLHRFYTFQPDLNIANPDVRDEMNRIMGFWLQLGVSGFRVDAAPYLIGGTGIENQMPQDPHSVLESMRGFLTRRRGDAVLFGEVNLEPGERETYFGDAGDEMIGLFDFLMCGAVFTAMAREEATPLADQLAAHRNRRAPASGSTSSATTTSSTSPRSGRRTRRASWRRSRRRSRCGSTAAGYAGGCHPWWPVTAGASSSPSACCSPCREPRFCSTARRSEWATTSTSMAAGASVRSCSGPTGQMRGFSTADADQIRRPAIHEGPFRFKDVNVAEQRRHEDSLLNRLERAIRVRKESPEFGWGESAQ